MKQRYIIAVLYLAAVTVALVQSGCELKGGQPRHTILLAVLDRPQYHVQDAKYWLSQAREQTGWRDLYIVHEEGRSKLYCGRYSSLEQAQGHLVEVRTFRTKPIADAPQGVAVFVTATIVPLPGIDLGPAEWRLINNEPDIRYTLVVAEFYNDRRARYTERERYAIEYCTQLRNSGHEAYLYHTQLKSYVTIGSFPESSYRMVTSNQTARQFAHRGQALPVILDPQLKQLVGDFPELAINGRRNIIRGINPQTGQQEECADPTFIMAIPHGRGAYAD